MNILVFSESPSLLAEMIGGAKELVTADGGGTAAAIMIGTESETASAFAMGADKVYWLGEQGDRMIDDYASSIAKLVQDENPAALLVGATIRGKSIAGRVAAKLDTTALVNAKEINNFNGKLQVHHMIFGGGAIRTEQPKDGLLIATVGPGVFSQTIAEPSRTGEIIPVEFFAPAVKITKLESKPKKSGGSNIASAKRVVGVGRGFAEKNDLSIARDLAAALGGEVGYTRPVTEGDPPFAEGEPYIGVTGISIKPDLYIAVGISGQTQHIIGINESRIVVCINKEPNALMFRHSDYGIIGDLYEVVPELTQALRRARQ